MTSELTHVPYSESKHSFIRRFPAILIIILIGTT